MIDEFEEMLNREKAAEQAQKEYAAEAERDSRNVELLAYAENLLKHFDERHFYDMLEWLGERNVNLLIYDILSDDNAGVGQTLREHIYAWCVEMADRSIRK